MTQPSFTPSGELLITAALSSTSNDFDFLQGSWTIQNRKLKSRLSNNNEWQEFTATGTMYKVLLGLGNIDDFVTAFDGKPFEGMTVRLFNPQTKLWSLYWADSTKGILDKPVVGSFDHGIGYFYNTDVFNGQDILVVFQWDKTDPDKPVWSQAFSTDKGKTWEWNWYMNFSRKE